MHALIFIAVSACFLGKATTISAQTCYFPDGSEATRDTPCQAQSFGQASACCAYFDVCLDNNLCLAQEGNEVVTRGTCTDRSWQSKECPQYCQDVHTSYGVTIYPFEEDLSFCCGPGNSSSNTCINSTRGSSAPFPVPAGRVIFNRTSGSISPNNSDAAAVTVSSTAAPATTATPPTDPTICRNSPSSSNKSTAVGFGVGVPLGLALLGALGLLWRQRSRELGARREARAWEEKYDELIKEENRGDLIGHERQVQELGCDCLKPDELDGRLVYEVAGT